jgi:hypothetical protein
MRVGMSSTSTIRRPALAIALSLWLAGFACLTSCTQFLFPSPVSEAAAQLSLSENNFPVPSLGHPANDAEPSCHHCTSRPSKPAGKNKHSPHTGLSCCPLEVTLTKKPRPVAPQVVLTLAVIPAPLFPSEPIAPSPLSMHSQVFWHTGRGTLLQTNLLRI